MGWDEAGVSWAKQVRKGVGVHISADKLGDFTHAVAGFTTITGTNIDSATEAFGRFFEMIGI